MFALPRVHVLDPRPTDLAAIAPLVNAVNLPSSSLKDALSELPPKGEMVLIADVEGADEAEAFLRRGGRTTRRVAPVYGSATSGRLWEPNPWVERIVRECSPGRAVDLGAGAGRDAIFLAAHGWTVTALDHSRCFCELGQERAGRYLPCPEQIEWCEQEVSDFTEFDGVNLLLSLRFLDRNVLEKASLRLPRGAGVLVQCFHPEHREATGHPRDEALVATPQELANLLGPDYEVRVGTTEVVEGKRFTVVHALKAK